MIESAFPKLIRLDEYSSHGEPVIQIVRPHEFNKLAHVKTASEAMDYIKNVKPMPGKTVILVLAMTAGEFYGPNRNGDAWPERPLRVGPTDITAAEVLPKHYQSFEQHANVFRHHINKDPDKRIGQVLKAFYNWPMHRVELLLALDNGQAEDVVNDIEHGNFPAVSMGCKVKHDICSICGNCAPSRKQYCDHAKYQLGETLPNGKTIFVWNPSPKFFDISAVRRPADRLGFMMKKVAETPYELHSSAELGEYVEQASRKVANLRKLSLIQKILNGNITAAKTDDGEVSALKRFHDDVAAPAAAKMPPFDDNTIRQLVAYHPAEVLSTLSAMGILLTTPEFIKYFVWKMDPTMHIPEEYLDRAVAAQHQIFSALAERPELLDSIEETGFLDIAPEHVNASLAEKMSAWTERRSQGRDWLYKRAIFGIDHWRRDPATGHAPGDYDMVNVTDPNTGKQFQTTQSAVRETGGAAKRQKLLDLLGGGAMMAGSFGLMAHPLGRLMAAPLGVKGYHKMHQATSSYPYVSADTGERIYVPSRRRGHTVFRGTELAEKQSEYTPMALADAVIKMAMEFAHHPRARFKKVAMISLVGEDIGFDEAARKVGDAICL